MRVLAFDPVVAALLVLAGLLYARAIATLRRRGHRVARGQQALWWGGLALLAVGLLGPPDAYDKRLMSAHMAQHLLIGDVAAPLLLAGLRTPVLVFFPPRALLVALARNMPLRRAFRFARRPLVAIVIYIVTVYLWHLDALFTGALRHPVLHALQHECFIAANLLLWWPVVEPKRARMPGELWKLGYIFGARMSTMFLGMVFVFARGVIYADYYGRGHREGLSAMADQQTAGGLMMTLDIVILVFAVCFFFWRFSLAHDESGAEAGPVRAAAGGA